MTLEDLEAVEDRLNELEQRIEQKDQRIADLEEENEQLRERVDDQDDRLEDVESGATLEWDGGKWSEARVEADDGTVYPIGPAIANRPTESDLEALEERLADGDLADDVEQNAAPDVPRETPLEDVVSLPEDVVDRSLDANEQRARFVARDFRDYGDKVPAGYRITAGRVGRTLRAGLDVDPHPETVRRVMNLLDDLAGDAGTLRKRNGEKRVILDEDLVDRLERHAETAPEAHTEMSPVSG
jgi:hypothetical protein